MKIISSEEKVSAKGNKYKRIRIEGNDNELACFSTFSKYSEVIAGAQVDGLIKEKDFNGKKSYTLEDENKPKVGGFGGIGVKAAQERKADMIEKAQDRKSESIAYFNSTNCAIELVGKLDTQSMTHQDIEEEIIYWRDWFLAEYRKYEASDITNKKNPF